MRTNVDIVGSKKRRHAGGSSVSKDSVKVMVRGGWVALGKCGLGMSAAGGVDPCGGGDHRGARAEGNTVARGCRSC